MWVCGGFERGSKRGVEDGETEQGGERRGGERGQGGKGKRMGGSFEESSFVVLGKRVVERGGAGWVQVKRGAWEVGALSGTRWR